MTRIETET